MDTEANVPNVTFNFSITPGNAKNSDGSSTLKIFAGNDANAVTGTPEISNQGNVSFKQGDTTYNSVQTQPDSVTVQNEDTKGTKNQDKLTLGTGKKYARKDVSIDFSNVSFKQPGVYRYIITESASTAQGITNDADNTRVLDVYVVDDPNDNQNVLSIAGYVLHNNENDSVVNRDGKHVESNKSTGFTNDYTTYNLTLKKGVYGDKGSRDEYFKFTVKISNAIAGTVYNLDLSNADATTKVNGINSTTHTNPASLTVSSDGTITQDYWLQNGQSIVIQGLAKNTKYEISEDAETINNEGYTVSARIIEGENKAGNVRDTKFRKAASEYKVTDDQITGDSSVGFSNTKGFVPTPTPTEPPVDPTPTPDIPTPDPDDPDNPNEPSIPTGLIFGTAGSAAAVIAGAVGIGMIIKKRKNEDDE